MAIHISAGRYAATIVEEGAGLASLTFDGDDLVLPHDPDVRPAGYSGKTLVPWPNRIAGGSYEWRGTNFGLHVNEPETGSALHGLAYQTDWSVVERRADSVTLATEVGPEPGYPFSLIVQTTYALDPQAGLSITITAKNNGDEDAPYGTSIHPYLTCGLSVDNATLSVPADAVLEVDENLTPVEETPVEGTYLDLRDGVAMSGRQVDHAFTGLKYGRWEVTLRCNDTGRGVQMASSTPWVQVYSGELLGRKGVAVEPMTCPPNAFNSGIDVIVLGPGEETTFTASISALPAEAAAIENR